MKRKYCLIAAILLFPVILLSQQIKNHNSKIFIKNAWIRPAARNANSALFFEVINNSKIPDTLLSARSNLAEIVELHETFKKENDMMGMREVHKVVVSAKDTLKFKPQGLHVMLIGLFKDVRVNEEHSITLVFKNAGTVKVKAIVNDMAKK